jgi:hypothetical protein
MESECALIAPDAKVSQLWRCRRCNSIKLRR